MAQHCHLQGGDRAGHGLGDLGLGAAVFTRDLGEAHELARTLLESSPRAEIGVTIHGVDSIAQARAAFDHLTRIGQDQLGLVPISYGLLVDDLHVYRAIAAQRPIGLAHPQAPATRALRDVARLLYEDARSRVLG